MFRFSAFLFCLLCGCMANNGLGSMADSEVNVYNISRLSTGMRQCEVLQVMKQPYSHETFEFDEAVYDVWFYVTKPTVLGQSRMVPQNLTPLAFKNGVLIGWGFSYYNYLVRKEDSEANKKPAEKKKEEDENLENILKAPSSSPKSSKTTPSSKSSSTPPAAQPEKKQDKQKNPPQKAPVKASGKPSYEKTETLKIEPSHTDSMKKPQSSTPDSLKAPKSDTPKSNKPPGFQQPPHKTSSLSMSASPKKPDSSSTSSNSKKNEKETEKNNKEPPLDDADTDMLDEASDQNFNQT